MTPTRFLVLAVLAAAFAATSAESAKTTPAPATNTAAPVVATNVLATIPDPTHSPVVVSNTVTIADERVSYTAETGMLPLLKPDGTSRASVFYVAYTRTGVGNQASRPVTFCFNGGPGSASLWLHLGALGPRRVYLNPDGSLPRPPFRLIDNQYSLLGASDLVFIDPVATGFSRTTKDEKPEQFFGNQGDLDAVGEFIRLWTTRHERWLSPKYILGESYGTYRAAGLAEQLSQHDGLYFNGLVLLSGVLDFSTISADPGNDLPYSLILPAYTAAAHFHQRLSADLQADRAKALAEARQFARGEYLSALQVGAALDPAERDRVVAELARLTGLKPELISDYKLRIDPAVFRKQLLHDQGLVLGAYDARLTGRDGDPAGPYAEVDPSMSSTMGPFSSAVNAYLRTELKFEDDLPYAIFGNVRPWNYGSPDSYPSASHDLAQVMNQNPYLRVLVLGGRCDLVCPIDTMHYSLDHMALAPEYRTNITYAEFEAGHMMYINLPDLQQLQRELVRFVSAP